MNMRKKEYKLHQNSKKGRYRPADAILLVCLPPILLCLVGILFLIGDGAPLTEASAAYFGGMLEYPVAALMIVTAGAVIADLTSQRDT